MGPQNPFESGATKRKNTLTGYAQEDAFDDATFKLNHRSFETQLSTPYQTTPAKRHKRQAKGDPSIIDGDGAYKGPWAKYRHDSESSEQSSENESGEGDESEPEIGPPAPEAAPEALTVPESVPESVPGTEPATRTKQVTESSEFFGKSLRDYMGRTYMHVPRDLGINLNKDPEDITEWYVPKRHIHTWAGHSGGTNRLKFFPKSGHLLLSSGNDGSVKLWDVYHDRDLQRSFDGHSRAIRDVDFNPDGTQFLSSSFDRFTKLWDTETGKVLARFNSGSVHNAVRFNPREPTSFVAATADHKIMQYDTRDPAQIVQEYNHHLRAVNTLTFVDDDRRFMTTSDDKTVRVWEWQINVPIKFISDPSQHSMPTVALHPSGKYVGAQSMDNKIVVIGARDKFRMHRKKEFGGYTNGGYALGIDFSPDGSYVMSGDHRGNAVFWSWKTTAIQAKIKAHKGPVTCIAAHPQETSKVVTAGNEIKYWD